jgi:hypothetical protein
MLMPPKLTNSAEVTVRLEWNTLYFSGRLNVELILLKMNKVNSECKRNKGSKIHLQDPILAQLVKNSPRIMQTKSLMPRSQGSVNGSHPQAAKSIPQLNFFNPHLYTILPSTPRSSK